jgi:hypothetical protein
VTIQLLTTTRTDFARWLELSDIETFARGAQQAGLITADAVAAWLTQLAHAGQEGDFSQA